MLGLSILVLLGIHRVHPVATVPFSFEHDEVLAQARIDGHGPYNVLLDTGTAPSVIDLRLARKLGLKPKSAGHAMDAAGTQAQLSYELRLPSVQVGQLKVKGLDCLAADLSGLSKSFGRRIDAVLGDSLFSGRVVQFDYLHRVARFFAAAPSPPPGSVTLPFLHENSEVHLTGVRINGQSVDANLDTGSNSRFSVTPRGIKRLKLEEMVAKARASVSTGFNGSYANRNEKVDLVEVGRFSVSKPTVGFWAPDIGHDENPWDVNIGNGFLKGYVVTVDYISNQVTLSPQK